MAAHKLTTTTGRTLTWAQVRKYQETEKPRTFDALRFKCDQCGEVDSLEVAEKLVVGDGRKALRRQVCTMCKFTEKSKRPQQAAIVNGTRRVTTTTTVKTEEVK